MPRRTIQFQMLRQQQTRISLIDRPAALNLWTLAPRRGCCWRKITKSITLVALEILERAGFQCDVAPNGREAIDCMLAQDVRHRADGLPNAGNGRA